MEAYLDPIIKTISFILILFLISNYILNKTRNTIVIPINWPIVGMLPHLLLNKHHFHDWSTGILKLVDDTFLFKGPWFTTMEILITTNPTNVHYVMSKNFSNFPKGSEFSRIFDILGDGIFNADFESWRYQREFIHSFLTHPSFHRFLTKTILNKVENGLIPILNIGYKSGQIMDLKDLFQRCTFDTICTLVTGNDPCCLSIDLPDSPFSKALDEAEEVLFLRHVVPETVWKLQQSLGIGSEKRLTRAWKVVDRFIYTSLKKKKNETHKQRLDENQGLDLLTLLIQESKSNEKFLRDMFLNLLIAGRDTTSAALTWFFFLLHKYPSVEAYICRELESIKKDFQLEELGNLVYLHGAFCEALRLYPPVPLEINSPLEPDVLPSGQRVSTSTKILLSLYAMGRSESIWGDDSEEFKPERWITNTRKIKHEPSYKFLAFNAGPRTCLGKHMAFLQMKAAAVTVLLNGYRLRVIDEHKVEPEISIILHTKHGLRVKVLKTPC